MKREPLGLTRTSDCQRSVQTAWRSTMGRSRFFSEDAS